MAEPTAVLLVEDQEMLRIGLRVSIERMGQYKIVGEAAEGNEAVREALRIRPDVILMDIGLPGIDGIEATWRIKQELPRTRVVMFTSHAEQEDVTAALGAGADGYCSKDTSVEQIAQAIDAVLRGEVWLDPVVAQAVASEAKDSHSLSEIEAQILSLLQSGASNGDIARRLQVTPQKIATVMHRIIDRFLDKKNTIDPPKEPEPKPKDGDNDWLAAMVDDMHGGTIFADKYLVQGLLGAGAIGAVFKAKQLYMDRFVALKLLRPEYCNDRFTMRYFQREAMAIANLENKNTVGVYDFGITKDGTPFLIMEYINGQSLDLILQKEKRLALPRLLNLCLQVCSALAEAHSKGVIHCDLKPSNLLIQGSEPEEAVKIVDFGLALVMPPEPTTQSRLTDKFFVNGTPLYMSPEQCNGGQLDARSDIYALGCILFEALTGVNFFEGTTAMETFSRQIQLVPPPMASIFPGNFSVEMESCVSRMLAKDPNLRPQSMEEVSGLLQEVLAAERVMVHLD
ncbi:MAG: protein kinase [Candidatus Melainabacteria bacterium]|nr:protein kinase [Candidatus Melainabacteria bacterium]